MSGTALDTEQGDGITTVATTSKWGLACGKHSKLTWGNKQINLEIMLILPFPLYWHAELIPRPFHCLSGDRVLLNCAGWAFKLAIVILLPQSPQSTRMIGVCPYLVCLLKTTVLGGERESLRTDKQIQATRWHGFGFSG